MGDVYQATDSKLGRSVAIKLLPDIFANVKRACFRTKRPIRTCGHSAVTVTLNWPSALK